VRRARSRAAEADLVLWMSDPQHQEHPHRGPAPVWTVRNKIDLDAAGAETREPVRSRGDSKNGDFQISASRGDGIGELMAGLVAYAQEYFGSDDGGLIGRERQRTLLQQTAAALQRALGGRRGGRGTGCGGIADRRFFTGPAARPGRCGRYSGCDLQRLLYREIIILHSFLKSLFHVKPREAGAHVSRETEPLRTLQLWGFARSR
jgi:Predicted GTPase